MIFMDLAEPDNIEKIIAPVVPVVRGSLNQMNKADYVFGSMLDGRTIQVNRTQTAELLSNIDSFEDELSRYYNNANEFYAIIEGIISPFRLGSVKANPKTSLTIRPKAPPGQLYTYSVSDSGFVFNEHLFDVSDTMYWAWRYQIDKAGITVMETINYVETAVAITAIYKNAQKSEHTTLNRYYKPRIHIKEKNVQVQALVNLSQAYKLNIGEVKAKQIIAQYGNLFNFLMADRGELERMDGIGKKTVDNIMEKVGREW
jgi:hypothetical protein